MAEPAADTFVAEVLRRHPALRADGLRRDALRKEASAEGRWPDPRLELMLDRVPDRMAEMPMARYTVQQMLMWPGKLGLMRAAVEARADGAGAALALRRLDVALQARRAWAMLALNARRREVNQANQELLATVARAARARFGAGAGGHHDLARAEVERQGLVLDQLTLDGEREATVAMLNALRDLPAQTAIADPAAAQNGPARTAAEPPAVADLEAAALRQRPELAAMAAMQREQARMAELAARERFPDLMVGLWWNQMLGGPDTVGAMVGAPLPLVGWGRQRLRAEAGGLQADAVGADLRAMQAMIRAEVADAAQRLRTAGKSVAYLQQSALPAAVESFDSAVTAYTAGTGDLTAVLEGRRALQTLGLRLAEAIILVDLARAELERAVGGPLPGRQP